MARSPYIIAGVAVLALSGWLASGMLTEEEPAETPQARERTEPQAPLVEVAASTAEPVTRHVIAQGDVGAFRSAPARTQTEGRVAEIFVGQGEKVEQGQPLIRLTLEGRGSRLREARALLEQRRQDYEAAATLLEEGYTTASNVRELRTQLESAREEVQRLEEEVGDTTVEAPFAGVVDSVDVEPGEYLTANAEVATLIDNSPLRTIVRVNQQDISRVEVGRNALVSYATGQEEAGRVCFVSAAADPETRTFRVEIRTQNAGNVIPSGISAEARIPTGVTEAHFVSPAILSLGTDGSLGLKTIGPSNTVDFHTVDVVRAQTNGVWVSGLPDEARIVTVGQGFVQAGDSVRVAEADDSSFAGTDLAEPPPTITGDVPEDICEREPAEVARSGIVAAVGTRAEEGGEPAEPSQNTGAAGPGQTAGTDVPPQEGEPGAADTGPAESEPTAAAGEPTGSTRAGSQNLASPGERQSAELLQGEVAGITAEDAPSAIVQPPDAETVAEVQRALNDLGYDAGQVDGVRGEQTREAVRSFQEEYGLPATGNLDAATVEQVRDIAEAEVPSGDGS